MDYPGHRVVTDDRGRRTLSPLIGSPVETITIALIVFVVACAVFQALV